MKTIKYASSPVNKWGLVKSEESEYERIPQRNGLALIVFLVPAVIIIGFIFSQIH